MRVRRSLPSLHASLVKRACSWLAGRRCSVVLPEFSTYGTSSEIPDVIGWRVSYGGATSVLVECKASRADFLADRGKPHREHPELGMGARRWYFAPPGTIRVEELPALWGLAECSGRTVRVVREGGTFREHARHHEVSLLVQAVRRERSTDPRWESKVFAVAEHAEEGSAGALECP